MGSGGQIPTALTDAEKEKLKHHKVYGLPSADGVEVYFPESLEAALHGLGLPVTKAHGKVKIIVPMMECW